jgi:hypothetical protein
VALGTVADDRNMLALDQRQVGVFVVEDLHGFPLVKKARRRGDRRGASSGAGSHSVPPVLSLL